MTNRILVVVDDNSAGASLKRRLEQAGYAVRLVSNAPVAIAELDCQKICLVLVDLDMPDQHAWNVLDRVTRCSPTVPVGIITGQQGQRWNRQVTSLGALLHNPLDAAELLRTIKALWFQGRHKTSGGGFLSVPRSQSRSGIGTDRQNCVYGRKS